jgi:glutathione peroxidase-family protein
MDTQQKDLSYFALRLQELLNTSFPEKAWDTKFINQRSSWATIAYEGAFLAGNPASQCNHIAEYILFEGLHFSKFDTVFQVVCNEFDTRMADEELHPFAQKMYPVCEPVFVNYILTDNFLYTTEFDLLYSELTGTIAIWIEENGLQ